MKSLSDYFYDLPAELIAQQPLVDRKASRLLVVRRAEGDLRDSTFYRFPELLRAGDTLVLNNTRVFPARLFGRTETGARVEVFLVRQLDGPKWAALAKPARRLKIGRRISFDEKTAAVVDEINDGGKIEVTFETETDLDQVFDAIGRTPLPPYIKRGTETPDSDRERYQTVYAKSRGAIAAPTAGLHFTDEVLRQISERGVEIVELTLHVGYGTFAPVRESDLLHHTVMPESVEITPDAAARLQLANEERRRIVAVGTTSTRALEWNFGKFGAFTAVDGLADLTITPGYEFKAVDAMLTNFHLPESSLLILVSTFAGHELIMKAYEHAVAQRYRFYSYGDCMFIS